MKPELYCTHMPCVWALRSFSAAGRVPQAGPPPVGYSREGLLSFLQTHTRALAHPPDSAVERAKAGLSTRAVPLVLVSPALPGLS